MKKEKRGCPIYFSLDSLHYKAKKASFFFYKATFKLLEFISILQQKNVVKKFVTETSVNFIPKNTILQVCPYIIQ